MSVSKVNINGVELEINLLDADVIERFEQLNKDISKKIQDPKAYEGKTTAEGMKFQCRCVEEYFDALFGLGTSNRVWHPEVLHSEKNHKVSDTLPDRRSFLLFPGSDLPGVFISGNGSVRRLVFHHLRSD